MDNIDKNNVNVDNLDYFPDVQITLSVYEKIRCLEEIISKLNKILYVYDRACDPKSAYDYKVFCQGILMYISSSNVLFKGELVNAVININSIINSDLTKQQLKRLVFDTRSEINSILDKYRKEATNYEIIRQIKSSQLNTTED